MRTGDALVGLLASSIGELVEVKLTGYYRAERQGYRPAYFRLIISGQAYPVREAIVEQLFWRD